MSFRHSKNAQRRLRQAGRASVRGPGSGVGQPRPRAPLSRRRPPTPSLLRHSDQIFNVMLTDNGASRYTFKFPFLCEMFAACSLPCDE